MPEAPSPVAIELSLLSELRRVGYDLKTIHIGRERLVALVVALRKRCLWRLAARLGSVVEYHVAEPVFCGFSLKSFQEEQVCAI